MKYKAIGPALCAVVVSSVAHNTYLFPLPAALMPALHPDTGKTKKARQRLRDNWTRAQAAFEKAILREVQRQEKEKLDPKRYLIRVYYPIQMVDAP